MVAAEGWKLPNFGHYKEGRLLPVSIIMRLRREEGSEDSVDGATRSSITKGSKRAMARRRALATWLGIDISGKGKQQWQRKSGWTEGSSDVAGIRTVGKGQ
ncbi:hypothetical protein B296_00003954 [Ensete ventricosum]|uniref:Uncharacterized protein n=1 Tax=Ensete ventricosum TaxID=4639 RepID=A0A427BA20_ENSVE|nr:hypothetical protein B296_00003954 [Ensete ventricosum]